MAEKLDPILHILARRVGQQPDNSPRQFARPPFLLVDEEDAIMPKPRLEPWTLPKALAGS